MKLTEAELMRLHPQSMEQLRQLLKLHGKAKILRAIAELEQNAKKVEAP
jgi:hypothetical protein